MKILVLLILLFQSLIANSEPKPSDIEQLKSNIKQLREMEKEMDKLLDQAACDKVRSLSKAKISISQCLYRLPPITKRCKKEIMVGIPKGVNAMTNGKWNKVITERLIICKIAYSLKWKFIITPQGPRFIQN